MKPNKSIPANSSGFKTPKGYFEDFEARLMENQNLKQGFLGNSNPGFVVPEAYFAEVEDKILAATTQPKKGGKVISIFRSKKLYAAVAILVIALATSIFLRNEAFKNSVEISAIQNYIEDGNMDLNTADISSFIYEDGFDIENMPDTSLNDEVVIDYLNENVEEPTYMFEK